jgi:hypothetical protein
MNKLLPALFLICIVVLGVIVHLHSVALREQRRELQELSARVESNSTPTVSLDLQEKCAKQAHEEFKHEGLEGKPLAEFSDHYNPKLGKCFVEVDYTDAKSNQMFVSRTVMDAFEGRVYASYIWNNSSKKKYWEVPPIKCSVTMLSAEERTCSSDSGPDGFDALIKQYME